MQVQYYFLGGRNFEISRLSNLIFLMQTTDKEMLITYMMGLLSDTNESPAVYSTNRRSPS